MEFFCLPIFWKAAGNTPASVTSPKSSPPPKTEDLVSDDEGPFFDQEFILPKENSGEENDSEDEDNDSHDKELKFNATLPENCNIPLEPKPELASAPFISSSRLSAYKFYTKCKLKEVPVASLFNSVGFSMTSEKKNSSNSVELVQKYLRKIKHLHVRVSERKAEEAMEKTGEKSQKLAMPERQRFVCERLGRCKSFSSTEATVSSPRRRDDSLQMRRDGIQSAIVHCKRSLNEFSEGTKLTESSLFQISKNDPGAECLKSPENSSRESGGGAK
ncbi:hypothetical protein KFK09_003691 [Dendrobium nobile]|uniref:Membrane-associated kinase regulator 2 n=1 Tax=Dendrobium nobile TaxID=94219 RepID=A0A8T3C395_DENNO|nr:hypothetical protein KFK09_003691 [Dendrobium nobile]